jgi:FixJ family two-component response regulator
VDLRSQAKEVQDSNACVVIVDDDREFRETLGRLLRSVGLHPRLFASIPDFLGSELPDSPTCLVLDERLPGRSGPDFQRDLEAEGIRLPIVFGVMPYTLPSFAACA